MSEFFPTSNDHRRDSYQAQTSGSSVDYDYDKVQVQGDDKNDENDVQKRSVKIDLTQKANALPDGTSNRLLS